MKNFNPEKYVIFNSAYNKMWVIPLSDFKFDLKSRNSNLIIVITVYDKTTASQNCKLSLIFERSFEFDCSRISTQIKKEIINFINSDNKALDFNQTISKILQID